VFNWRDHLDVHPAADLFPRMSESELKELAEDIRKNGLQHPIVTHYCRKTQQRHLIDGVNRLDALALLGWLGPPKNGGEPLTIRKKRDTIDTNSALKLTHLKTKYDLSDEAVYCYVIAANVHRRHLTAEQKRELIAKVLKATPEKSNNQIAKDVKVDDKTVGSVRAEMESRSEIPNVGTRTDTKGRKQPAKRKKKPVTDEPSVTLTNGESIDPSKLGTAAQSQITNALADSSEPIEPSAEARKALYAASEPTLVPADAATPEAPPAPESTTIETMIQDAAAKSENERNEITQILDTRLPRLLTVDKQKLFSYIINHPALASVKVPKREVAVRVA
jgi:hypothetical protein